MAADQGLEKYLVGTVGGLDTEVCTGENVTHHTMEATELGVPAVAAVVESPESPDDGLPIILGGANQTLI